MQCRESIESGRLSFRENCLLDDASLRRQAVRALQSYHSFWLCLAMETVLGRQLFTPQALSQRVVRDDADIEAILRDELLSDVRLRVCKPHLRAASQAISIRMVGKRAGDTQTRPCAPPCMASCIFKSP